jgi:hypothetical protein
MQRQTVQHVGKKPVIIMDSIGRVGSDDAGAIIVAASHGGKSSAEIALAVPLTAVFFNDAGSGKDDAGIAGLKMLQDKGVAGGTVGHETACIGDPSDMWESGILTHVNEKAAVCGLAAGQRLRDVIGKLSTMP